MPRFLIIQLARFGDLLQTARLVQTLAERGEVHLCVDTSLTPLARLVYPEATLHGLPAHMAEQRDEGAVFAALRPVLADLSGLTFDAVYNLNHSPLNRALGRLFPPDSQHGHRMEGGQPLRDRWVRLAFRWTGQRRTAPLNLADFWAFLAPEPVDGARVNPPATPGGKGLGVVLSGRHARRSLPPEVLAPLVHALCERLGGPPVYLFGTRNERGAGRALAALLPASMQDRLHNLAGRTDWADLADALTGLDALLTPDTGTMHLAARLGVPVEALFLSSAWAFETGPYGAGHRVWQAAPACAPCLESAACTAEPCLAPFQSRWLLRALAGQSPTAPPPPGLFPLRTSFDDLGVTLEPAFPADPASPAASAVLMPADNDEFSREALRHLLATHRLQKAFRSKASLRQVNHAADTFYQEADWMLPHETP